MSHLGTIFPRLEGVRLPLSRDQLMLLVAAVSELFLGLDTFLAHSISGTIRPNEWIPIVFGPVAGVLLLLAGLVALRARPLATVVATLTLLASIVVGLLGAYFHIARALPMAAPPGERVTIEWLVWAPPVLGPTAFALIGIIGISAAWIETPPDSGRLRLLAGRHLRMPFSKTRAYFLLVGLGTEAALISSVLDHARTGFHEPWLWVAAGVGIVGTVAGIVLGLLPRPGRWDLGIYLAAMLLLIVLGLAGAAFHINANLVGEATVVTERFIRGAPFLAPLLFSEMGVLGIITLLDPAEPGVERAGST